MVRFLARPAPETVVGATGALLLVTTYAVLASLGGSGSPVDVDAGFFVRLAAPAFVVGVAVAVLADRFVPDSRLTRRGHAKTALLMVVAPVALLGVAVLVWALTMGLVADALSVAPGAEAGLEGLAALLLILFVFVAVILLILLAMILAVVAVVVQFSALAGYALATWALNRMAPDRPPAAGGSGPPD